MASNISNHVLRTITERHMLVTYLKQLTFYFFLLHLCSNRLYLSKFVLQKYYKVVAFFVAQIFRPY